MLTSPLAITTFYLLSKHRSKRRIATMGIGFDMATDLTTMAESRAQPVNSSLEAPALTEELAINNPPMERQCAHVQTHAEQHPTRVTVR